MTPEMKKRLEDTGFGVYDTPEELFEAIWPTVQSNDDIIAELHTLIHDNNNKAMSRQSVLELQNMKLKKALLDVVNFEWNAWTDAKALLISIDGDNK